MKIRTSFEVSMGGKTYVFVLCNEDFTHKDAVDYLSGIEKVCSEPDEIREPAWQIPDNKHSRRIFLDDFRQMGLDFCVAKYGQGAEAILREVSRLGR